MPTLHQHVAGDGELVAGCGLEQRTIVAHAEHHRRRAGNVGPREVARDQRKLARLGSVIKFVPYPVTVGFTGGIALIIAAAQVRDLFGLQMAAVPADFIEKLTAYGASAANIWPCKWPLYCNVGQK